MSTAPSLAKWGPIVFGLGPVEDPEDLRRAAQELGIAAENLARAADEKFGQWQRATDREVRKVLWSEYDELWREYRVMGAWSYAARAAVRFAEEGYVSQYLNGITEITEIDLPTNVG